VASLWFDGIDRVNTLAVDLAKSGVKVGAAAQTVVAKVAHDVEASAKAFCPVDTGNLRGSIGTDLGVLQAAIGPTASYGGYVEWGTSRMGPHAYMGPALDRHAAEFEDGIAIAAQRGTL
jgi:HK97 gp10 family phage protein